VKSREPSANGFTLVEVMVALVVTGLMLGIIMAAATTAKARARFAEDKRAATVLAASLYEERTVLDAGRATAAGKVGRVAWEADETELSRDPRGFFILTQIHIRLKDQEGRLLYSLIGRKLKPVPAL
jgi:prepilin-type N-terminal cleavage/methylation domain-containing protein